MKKFIRSLLLTSLMLLLGLNCAVALAAQNSSQSGQIVADRIASAIKEPLYNLNAIQLREIVVYSVSANREIMSLTITDTSTKKKMIRFYRQGEKEIYDEPIPDELPDLMIFTSAVVMDDEKIGTVKIGYRNTKARPEIKLANKEKAWLKEPWLL